MKTDGWEAKNWFRIIFVSLSGTLEVDIEGPEELDGGLVDPNRGVEWESYGLLDDITTPYAGGSEWLIRLVGENPSSSMVFIVGWSWFEMGGESTTSA